MQMNGQTDKPNNMSPKPKEGRHNYTWLTGYQELSKDDN